MRTLELSALGRRTAEPPISWLMATALARPDLISLAAGFTDHASLPVKEAGGLLEEILRSPKSGRAALQYGTTIGDTELRTLTARRLAKLDGSLNGGTPWSPERTVLTNGSQQLLYMVTEALCDPGDIVIVEDPTYFVYLSILQSHGIATRGVRMEPDGLDLTGLEELLASLKRSGQLPRVKLLYLVSYHQNPTGITTSYEKKARALELLRQYERAAGHPIYLLEDAAYRELRFEGPDVKSALTIRDGEERVIYAGTYSKPFATGTRVGFGILPQRVLTPLLRIKGNHDFGSSNLLQKLLARAIASGRYELHLSHLHQRYAHKANVMLDGMRQHFPAQVQWERPKGGLYYWARLPHSLKSGMKSRLFAAALANKVLYVPGELCYAEDPTRRRPNHEMRLSFGAETEVKLRGGLSRLGTALHELLG